MTDLPGVVAAGVYVDSLIALRDELAKRLIDCGNREAAALSKQLADVLKEIEARRIPEAKDAVDEVASRRARRRAGAASP